MSEKIYTSQICTTKEQSERLLALGLKKETADMMCCKTSYGEFITVKDDDYLENLDSPAWSLHRLIEMCNKTQFGMTISIYNSEVTVDGYLFEVYDNTYDNLISVIEWLIKLGHFNKEYLEEKQCVK